MGKVNEDTLKIGVRLVKCKDCDREEVLHGRWITDGLGDGELIFMIEMSIYCDFCRQRMPGDEDDNVKVFTTKEIDTKDLFPHLCKNCADKLDKTMLLCKKRWLEEGDKIAQIAERNAARRELLGTKG